ncbi:MAG: hypothetical protein HY791_29400, partial [Deltaproteobacteria bacterium]|nr:hypothetical protein [Deltaproteobacteria bacterium]
GSAHGTAVEWRLNQLGRPCVPAAGAPGDLNDDDCDGRIDEELANVVDDDGDSRVDEDLARGQGYAQAPPIAYGFALTTQEDRSIALTLPAFDVNGDPLFFDVVGAPARGTLHPLSPPNVAAPAFASLIGLGPTMVYRPLPDDFGADELRFVARDPTGASNVAVVPIQVVEAPDAPNITSTPQITSVLEGDEFAYDATANDPDPGQAVTWTLPLAPQGASVSASGQVRLLTSNAVVGPQLFTLQATDPTGLSDTQSFTVEVIDVNAPPRWTTDLPNPGPLPLGELYLTRLVATDDDPGEAPAVRYSLDEAPSRVTSAIARPRRTER